MKPRTTDEQKEICRKEWFKNHVATAVLNRDEIIIINWASPESWNYGCRFLIHARWLTVVGDIGEAVYEWGQTLTLPFLSGLDFGYFMGKCQASEVGRRFQMWDAAAANARAQEWLKEQSESDQSRGLKARGHISNISAHTARDEFEQYVRDAYNDGLDPEDCSSLIEGGLVPNCRCVGHFVGLQMAIEQLKEKAKQPDAAEVKFNAANEAIRAVFTDLSQSQEDTASMLRALRDEIDAMLYTLPRP